jgi:RNA polymerase sigma-70 factor (ECF subfamily)
MNDDLPFAEWMTRVRAGDPDAAEQLVRRYERAIRVRVRTMLTDPAMRRQLDSVDVCQSVLGSFFTRVAAGQFDLENPAQLVALLARMARNKVGMAVRHQRRDRRDNRREAALGDDVPAVADAAPGPQTRVLCRDLLHTLLDRLTPEERELAQRRALGQGWNEIAAECGGTPDGLRMKLARAIDRVAPELGLVDGSPDGEGRDD